jgi:hypothetical protein
VYSSCTFSVVGVVYICFGDVVVVLIVSFVFDIFVLVLMLSPPLFQFDLVVVVVYFLDLMLSPPLF